MDKKIEQAKKLIEYLKDNWKGGKELLFEDVDISEDSKRVIVKGKTINDVDIMSKELEKKIDLLITRQDDLIRILMGLYLKI
jgi:hypothetical protein